MARWGASNIGRQHFTYLHSLAGGQAFNPRNVPSRGPKLGCSRSILGGVLRDTPNPPAEADELQTSDGLLDTATYLPETPVSPQI